MTAMTAMTTTALTKRLNNNNNKIMNNCNNCHTATTAAFQLHHSTLPSIAFALTPTTASPTSLPLSQCPSPYHSATSRTLCAPHRRPFRPTARTTFRTTRRSPTPWPCVPLRAAPSWHASATTPSPPPPPPPPPSDTPPSVVDLGAKTIRPAGSGSDPASGGDVTSTSTSTSSSALSSPSSSMDEDNNSKATQPPTINQQILKIALPALGTLALDPLVALADMACVGHLGALALGGVGIGNNVYSMSFTCFNFLGLATTPAIARAYARGDLDEASRLIAQALWVAVVSGVSAMLLLSCFTAPVLRFFGANDAILPHAVAYLRARIVAAPFFLTAMVGNGTFRGFQDTRTPLFVGLFANAANLVLYPTLIFALGWGTRGAGVAMAVGQIAAGCTLLALLLRTGKLKRRDLFRAPRWASVLPLLRTGAVLSVRTLSIYSTISYATATAARMGTVQVAAFEIGRQIFALFARLLDAISVAAQALVALALGRDDSALARRTANRILSVAVAMGCGFVALLMLVVNTAPSVFTRNPAVRAAVTRTFPFMAIIQPVNGLVFVFDGVFTAARRFSTLSAAIFVSACAASAFLAAVRATHLPLHFVWIGLNIMMLLRASILGFLYISKWSPVPAIRTPTPPASPATAAAAAAAAAPANNAGTSASRGDGDGDGDGTVSAPHVSDDVSHNGSSEEGGGEGEEPEMEDGESRKKTE